MADRRDQSELEFRVFAEFRERSGLPVFPETVTKRNPPEPDIYCEIEERGGVAFELAALCDRKSAHIMSRLAKDGGPDEGLFWRLDSRGAIRHVCLTKRRNRSYVTQSPVELVLYADGLMVPEDVAVPCIRSAFQHGSSLGIFQRVWFMGKPNECCRSVLSRVPESDTNL